MQKEMTFKDVDIAYAAEVWVSKTLKYALKKIAGKMERYEGECRFATGFLGTRIVSCMLL